MPPRRSNPDDILKWILPERFSFQGKRTQVVTSWKVSPLGTEAEVGLKATGSRRDTSLSQEGQMMGPAKETSKNLYQRLQEKASFQTPAKPRKCDTHLWQRWPCKKYGYSCYFYIQPPPALAGGSRTENCSALPATGFSWRQSWDLIFNPVRTCYSYLGFTLLEAICGKVTTGLSIGETGPKESRESRNAFVVTQGPEVGL